jgi:hypothetical protein
MKKKLDVDKIQSELREGSAFFPGYKRDNSSQPEEPIVQVDQSNEGMSRRLGAQQCLTGARPAVAVWGGGATRRQRGGRKGACRVGREVTRPGPSPEPDERMSRIRLFRRCGSWLYVSTTFTSSGDLLSNVSALAMGLF